jgi:hypothetical protein
MPPARNAMEIFARLDKSNCRRCGEKTCLALAGAVFTGKKSIRECPLLDAETYRIFDDGTEKNAQVEERGEDYMLQLKKSLQSLDLTAAAERCGGRYQNGRLRLKILGKDFSVDNQGNLSSDIHINSWVVVPFLTYILNGKGYAPVGEWISFREIHNGKELYPLFQKRCEEAMKRVADIYTDLFADIVQLFHGQEVDQQFASDVAVVLLPLPKVPIMICYWRADEGLASSLNIFFDRTADDNLGLDALYQLCAGLNTMFEKLAERHGYVVQAA